MKFMRISSFACCALVLGPFSPPSLALEGDSEQPIRIVAEEALRDERTGLTVYRGNVQMDQGTIRIEAEQITIYRIESEGDKIVAEGSPAHMQQQPEPDSAPMHAWAGIIEYYRTEDRLQLRGDAVLEQDGSKVQGDRIDYYIKTQQIKATADESDGTRRVEVVIPSHRLEE